LGIEPNRLAVGLNGVLAISLAVVREAAIVESGGILWVNPDCGLKTRQWAEVLPALRNMVAAARTLRAAP